MDSIISDKKDEIIDLYKKWKSKTDDYNGIILNQLKIWPKTIRKFSSGFKRGNITIKVIIIGSIMNKNNNLIFKYFDIKLWSSTASVVLLILRGLKIPKLIKYF